ncbi:hypothetical protein [Streptomyces sp. NPDC093097]|uniref:hypothetical protein n=1 Tax=Streptomyces sp. NPDC093097 TaxID=3366027 RepID=UPI00382D5C77
MSAIGALIMFAFFVLIAGEPLAEELPFKTAGAVITGLLIYGTCHLERRRQRRLGRDSSRWASETKREGKGVQSFPLLTYVRIGHACRHRQVV